MLAGATGVGIWAWSIVRSAMVQTRDNSAFERRLVNREPWSPAVRNGELVGRLIIPRLHLRATVREGAGEDTLAVALGHIPGTAWPGQNGNVGVAGHRDTLFRALRKIAKQDQIQFQTLAGSYQYEVESTAIVPPGDMGVLAPGEQPEITLVTCYPFDYVGSAPDRFVVKARLVSQAVSERTRSSLPPSPP
jgi:sortase A